MHVRPSIEVRQATADDAPALVELWNAVRNEANREDEELTPTSATVANPTVDEAARVLEFNEQRHGRHILVAVMDDRVIGVAGADVTTFSIIAEPKVLLITDFLVHPDFRRRAVGASLLKAVAGLAEQHDCSVVAATLPPWAKEPNRYLTKLGFNQVAIMRGVPISRLHARLAAKSSGSRETGRMVALRRSLRRKSTSPDESKASQ